jgi:hypothetical protein
LNVLRDDTPRVVAALKHIKTSTTATTTTATTATATITARSETIENYKNQGSFKPNLQLS